MLKLAKNIDVLKWWQNASPSIKSAVYFEVWLGSKARTFMCVNYVDDKTKTIKQKTIFRVRNDFRDKFKYEEIPSAFLNVSVLRIIKLK